MFDVHAHQVQHQTGGLLLSIEGQPSVPGGVSYKEMLEMETSSLFYKVPYLYDLNQYQNEKLIYIHPRRNHFVPQQVAHFLKQASCKLVVLDTFSSFFWSVQDYYELINSFKNKTFLLAHGGGYQAREFAQLARFTTNTFIDFSATQEIFGCVDGNKNLSCGVLEVILHAIEEPRLRKKLLFGSDNPEFDQLKAMQFYKKIDSEIFNLFDENFQRMMSF